MFQQPGQGAGGAAAATRRKFGTSIDVNSTRNADAAGKGGKAGAGGVEKRTTRSTTRSGQMRDDADVQRPAIQQQRANSTASRSSSFTVSNPSSYQHTGQVDNIDDRDREDPLCATDYVQEMVSKYNTMHASQLFHAGISSTYPVPSFGFQHIFSTANTTDFLTTQMCHSPPPSPNSQFPKQTVPSLPRQGGLHFRPTDVHGEPDPHQRADARHPR